MKKNWLRSSLSLLLALYGMSVSAQTIKEVVQPLSNKATKGYLDDVTFEDGNINVLYKISGDKKKDELFYEKYVFDKDLKFVETKPANEPKVESKPDRERKYLSAWVGGTTSFDVLSMKLRVNVRNQKEVWNYKRQRYVREKVLSNETVKLKNENGHAYYGVEKFAGGANDILVLAYYETKDKANPRQYVWLTINFDGGFRFVVEIG